MNKIYNQNGNVIVSEFIDKVMKDISPYIEEDDYVSFELTLFNSRLTLGNQNAPDIAIYDSNYYGPCDGLPRVSFKCKKKKI